MLNGARIASVLIITVLLNSCSLVSLINKRVQLKLAYSSDQEKLVQEISQSKNKNSILRSIKFTKIEPNKAKKLLKEKLIDAYLGTLPEDSETEKPLTKNLIAKDGIVIITNQKNPIYNLNLDTLSRIFTRTIGSWKALGLADNQIIFINKKSNNETRMFLETFFNKLGTNQTSNQFEVNNDTEALELLEQYEYGLSYISFSSLNSRVNAPQINNIAPTQINISSGTFPIFKPIFIYESEKVFSSPEKRKLLRDFLHFMWSPEATRKIKASGFVPLSPAELEVLKAENHPFTIGVSAPLSGPYVELGRAIVNGAKLAVQEANERRSQTHREFELIICDDKAELGKGLECANQFIESQVFGVVGHLNSLVSIEASKLYSNHDIVQISPGSTHPWLTESNDVRGKIFRTIDTDEKQAEKLATAISKLKIPKKENILILHNETIYGSNLATLIENFLLKYLGEDIQLKSKSFNVNDSRYHLQLKDFNPDIIVFIGEYSDAAQMLVDLALDNKSNISFFGADGNFSKRFIDLAGLRAEGAYILGCDLDQDSEKYKDFEKKYKDLFHSTISSFSIYSYDASNILINAMQKLDSENINESLAELVSHSKTDSYCGEISFDENGNPKKPRIAIFKVVKGKFVKTEL